MKQSDFALQKSRKKLGVRQRLKKRPEGKRRKRRKLGNCVSMRNIFESKKKINDSNNLDSKQRLVRSEGKS